uniref:Uncharacterized protein n=1 Tax=Oryza sativa subsp. japonica TaxID=39947 RepID=Q5Z843_ORYSJ|nr:hypothetical protein [Oryza sativa Japonica Group]
MGPGGAATSRDGAGVTGRSVGGSGDDGGGGLGARRRRTSWPPLLSRSGVAATSLDDVRCGSSPDPAAMARPARHVDGRGRGFVTATVVAAALPSSPGRRRGSGGTGRPRSGRRCGDTPYLSPTTASAPRSDATRFTVLFLALCALLFHPKTGGLF